jgi:hypothetical protein
VHRIFKLGILRNNCERKLTLDKLKAIPFVLCEMFANYERVARDLAKLRGSLMGVVESLHFNFSPFTGVDNLSGKVMFPLYQPPSSGVIFKHGCSAGGNSLSRYAQ